MYCFVNWRQALDGEGKEPDLPEELSYGVLAEPCQDSDCVLVQVVCAEDYQPEMLVSVELDGLLGAAEQYAPALAITRETLGWRKEPADTKEFERLLVESLRSFLRGQRDAPYFLAEALVTEPGYKYAGTYYWIVGYRPERIGREIDWVSRDFFIYQDSISDFAVEAADLEQRFKRSG